MGNIGFSELLPIVFLILLLFGSKKIPELLKGIGTGIKDFKKALTDENDDKEKNH